MNLRDTTVLEIAGTGGIGAHLVYAVTLFKWESGGAILLGPGALGLIVERISSEIRRRIMYGE